MVCASFTGARSGRGSPAADDEHRWHKGPVDGTAVLGPSPLSPLLPSRRWTHASASRRRSPPRGETARITVLPTGVAAGVGLSRHELREMVGSYLPGTTVGRTRVHFRVEDSRPRNHRGSERRTPMPSHEPRKALRRKEGHARDKAPHFARAILSTKDLIASLEK
jgi:hypothetical protein